MVASYRPDDSIGDDVEKEDRIEGLSYGAKVDGKLLCDDCLPKDHPASGFLNHDSLYRGRK
jgi:hypothetical protein